MCHVQKYKEQYPKNNDKQFTEYDVRQTEWVIYQWINALNAEGCNV